MEDFVITNFKKSCNGFKKVEAITGRNDVAAVREADFRFEEKWKVLRDEIKAIPRVDFIQVSVFFTGWFNYVRCTNSCNNYPVPFSIRSKC